MSSSWTSGDVLKWQETAKRSKKSYRSEVRQLSASICPKKPGFLTTAGSAGGNDLANVTGALTYGGALTLDLGTIFGTGTYSWNLFDFAGADSGTFSTITLTDQYSGSLTDGDSNGIWDLTSGNNTWQFTESTGVLGLTVVPEPSAALLGALGMLVLLRRRR